MILVQREAVKTKGGKIVASGAAGNEVGHDLADDAAELEPVPRTRGDDEHLRRVGVPVDDEVLVGCVREHADGGVEDGPVGARKVAGDGGAEHGFVGRMAGSTASPR
jgi:hypothetical protein